MLNVMRFLTLLLLQHVTMFADRPERGPRRSVTDSPRVCLPMIPHQDHHAVWVTLSSFSSGSLNEAVECLTFEREICVRLPARASVRENPTVFMPCFTWERDTRFDSLGPESFSSRTSVCILASKE